ncbi:MAG: thioredoxin TrxC [Proteobacteria bacterium]|nr:thioredoxin TrxC [Pseudomonadota bacterium]MDA1057752.1 thioredoxin TrxC [Pseudomonadota bacterium]
MTIQPHNQSAAPDSAYRVIPCPSCQASNRVPDRKPHDQAKCGKCGAKLFQYKPIALDAASFDRHARAVDLPLVVDFWADWCGPCKMMAPQFEAAAKSLEPRVRLGKVDTEANQDLAARFNIRSIPTMILFRGGKEVARVSGAMSAPQLRAWVEGQIG